MAANFRNKTSWNYKKSGNAALFSCGWAEGGGFFIPCCVCCGKWTWKVDSVVFF